MEHSPVLDPEDETICSSETSGVLRTTRPQNPECRTLHRHCCKILKLTMFCNSLYIYCPATWMKVSQGNYTISIPTSKGFALQHCSGRSHPFMPLCPSFSSTSGPGTRWNNIAQVRDTEPVITALLFLIRIPETWNRLT
jgi:hypothetical protein